MKQYHPVNYKEVTTKRLWLRRAGGAFLIAICIPSMTWWGIIVGVLVLAGSLQRKKILLDETGIHIYYDATFFKHEDSWDYREIEYIHKDYRTKANHVMLHFAKGFMTRKYLFPLSIGSEVIRTAKRRNPEIIVEDVD